MKLKPVFLSLLFATLFLSTCKDSDQIGSSVQPDEDKLKVHSNMVYVEDSRSLLIDSVLSKSSYLFLGRYWDEFFGETQAEFISQLDSRLGFGGLTIPDTTVSASSATLLNGWDAAYGNITAITSPDANSMRVDSVVFLMQYTNDIFGDTLQPAVQWVAVYELNETLVAGEKYYTNADVSKYCDKNTLLGKTSYQINSSREIQVPLNKDLCKKLLDIYKKGSSVNTQEKFNEVFKGIYVSHDFNGGNMININVAGIIIYYSYEALIHTTYNERDTVIHSAQLRNSKGELIDFRLLQTSFFLSANKAVERLNLVKHVNLKDKFLSIQELKDFTYTFTPAGLYTSVHIPLKIIKDSIIEGKQIKDIQKVIFNGAHLKIYAKELDWKTDLSATPNSQMLLMHKDSVVSFFHKNLSYDGMTSFLASYNNDSASYTFDLTKAIQKEISEQQNTFSENMVIVPIVVELSENVYYYRQQLGMTATKLYGSSSPDEVKRPRLDLIYTQRR